MSQDKKELNNEIKELRAQLLARQQQIREAKLPIIVLLEGWSAAGKGSLIKELISEIDPRFYTVVSPVIVPETKMSGRIPAWTSSTWERRRRMPGISVFSAFLI